MKRRLMLAIIFSIHAGNVGDWQWKVQMGFYQISANFIVQGVVTLLCCNNALFYGLWLYRNISIGKLMKNKIMMETIWLWIVSIYIFKQIYFKINYLSPIWIQYNTSYCLKSLPWKTSFILIWQWTILFHKCGITTKSRMTLLYICFQTAS